MSRCPVRVPFAITDLSVRVAIRPGSGSRAARGALLVWLVHIMRRAPGVPVATGVFWHLWVVAWVARAVAARALVLRRGGAFTTSHLNCDHSDQAQDSGLLPQASASLLTHDAPHCAGARAAP